MWTSATTSTWSSPSRCRFPFATLGRRSSPFAASIIAAIICCVVGPPRGFNLTKTRCNSVTVVPPSPSDVPTSHFVASLAATSKASRSASMCSSKSSTVRMRRLVLRASSVSPSRRCVTCSEVGVGLGDGRLAATA